MKYADIIETIAKDNYPADQVEWVVNYMMDSYFKPYSYESLILPHINECSTIIIDHGYNDRLNIVHECLGYPNVNGVLPSGTSWLKELINGGEYKDAFGMGKYSYIGAMFFIIDECKKANPDVKIMIGNYFASRSPEFESNFNNETNKLGSAKVATC